jgi:sucrose-6-phosphate hydrolase SacC (GH32 family)
MTKLKILCFVFLITCSISVCAQANLPVSGANDTLFNEKFRPQYHLTPVKGWVNDPTALVYVDGYYHFNKGLAVSKDLIHWERSDIHNSFNSKDTVAEMSGSAVLDNNNTSGFGINGKAPIVSIYSGLRFKDIMQFQCVSYSNDNGRTWKQYDHNPVIDIGSTEFRDPQVFWHEQTKKWVMVVALAAERKVQFYHSDNLREWKFLSDFGPFGAAKGVWECPDIFPLAVDGNKQNIKWVLEVGVQPNGGQYFVGFFDGTHFIADKAFLLPFENKAPGGNLLFDFEENLAGWKIEGTSFSSSPCGGSLAMQGAVLNFQGKKLVNSFYNGDSTVGRLVSPSFKITGKYINFLVGGGDHKGTLSVNLVIDGKNVRTQTGPNSEAMYWANWNVAEYAGKNATIEILDNEKGGFGHITVDHIMISDQPAVNEREKAYWIDYGPDFYAVRSWVNGPVNDERRIWIAWMSNWLYANDVPTKPWKGMQTFPRTVELKTFPEGIRMVQKPISEIEMLRTRPFHLENLLIKNKPSTVGFKPVKNSYEMIVELDPSTCSDVGIKVAVGKNEATTVNYNKATQTLSVDRTKSGNTSFSKSFPGIYSAPLKLRNRKKLKLHILVDQASIEVFGNDGETTITCQIFPDVQSTGIEFYSKGGSAKVNKMDSWELLPFWKN